MQVGIVVLNYFNYAETVDCVKSILKQIEINFEVVIVDNGSGNESFEILNDIFKGNELINIIKTDKNLGYARGNNVGIEFLRNKGIEWIFIANSDLVFQNNSTLKNLVDSYEPGIGVINPIIINPDKSVDQRVAYKKKFLYLRMIKKFIEWFIGKKICNSVERVNRGIEETKKITGIQSNMYVISGSGFMLCKDFFEHYNGLYPGTFLYCEEWATIILLHKADLKTKVAETYPIIHKGGASTPQSVRNMTKERRKICMESWKAIFKLMVMPSK